MAVVLGPDAIAEVLLDGDEHRHHQQIMQHAFLPARISAYVGRMTPAITRNLASWPADGAFEVARDPVDDLHHDLRDAHRLRSRDRSRRGAPDVRGVPAASYSPLRLAVPGLAWSLQFSHHMPELWSQPSTFDPLRFGPDRAEDKVHRYAWVPFDGGVHHCIGMHFATAGTSPLQRMDCRSG